MIRDEMEQKFDPTDADQASGLAHAACKVMVQVARAVWSESRGMRMGRDTCRDLSVALNEMAIAMRVLPCGAGGKDVAEFWRKLCAETGLEDQD